MIGEVRREGWTRYLCHGSSGFQVSAVDQAKVEATLFSESSGLFVCGVGDFSGGYQQVGISREGSGKVDIGFELFGTERFRVRFRFAGDDLPSCDPVEVNFPLGAVLERYVDSM